MRIDRLTAFWCSFQTPNARPGPDNIYNGVLCPKGRCNNMECGGNSWDGAGPAAESYLQCPMGMKFPGQGSPEVRVINFYDF